MATPKYRSIQRERQDFVQLLKYWKTICGGLTGIFTLIPIGGFFIESLLPDVLGQLAPLLGIIGSVLFVLFLYYTNRVRQVAQIEKMAKSLFLVGFICLVIFVCWLQLPPSVGAGLLLAPVCWFTFWCRLSGCSFTAVPCSALFLPS